MSSRQERRKAERDAAKRGQAQAQAQAGAAGAAGAAAALANLHVNVNPLGDWTTQAEDPGELSRALGPQMVKQRADAGDREAQYSLGYHLVSAAGRIQGESLGAGGKSPKSDEGVALLEKAAGQGHAYAMSALGSIHHERKEHEQAVAWFTKAAEAGLPEAMFNLGCILEKGDGAAQDLPAAMDWYRRAADAGHGRAAHNISGMYRVGTGGFFSFPNFENNTTIAGVFRECSETFTDGSVNNNVNGGTSSIDFPETMWADDGLETKKKIT
jgi:TPR repeat protein